MAESGGPSTQRAWSSIGEGEGMDPRDRADAVLARAQRRSGVVTPDNMQSPMDSSDTQVIPSSVVRSAEQDPDATAKVPASVIERNDESHLSQPSPTVPLSRREAAAAARAASPETAAPETGASGSAPRNPSEDTAPQRTAPQYTAPQGGSSRAGRPALAENARTQPLATQGAQPVDTANVPPDMTFTGAAVTPGASNPATQTPADAGTPHTAEPAGEDTGRSGETASGGFVPTTKAEPGTGTSELARRLEGL